MNRIVIVNAGLGDPSTTRRIADSVAAAAVRHVTAAGEGAEVRAIDLRTLATDLATYMTTQIPTAVLTAAQRAVTGADALIAATPVFQGSYAGLFKMFFDTLGMRALDGTPVTMVATAGTQRHSMVLDYAVRPLLSFLHAVVLPTGVFAATGEFGQDTDLESRIDRAGREMASRLTAVDGVRGFTAPDADGGEDADSEELHAPEGGFAALLAGHAGE
jgi:FMN reductase